MFRISFRNILLAWLSVLAPMLVHAQASFTAVPNVSYGPNFSYVQVDLRLTQIANGRPLNAAPGTSDFVLAYNPRFFNITNNNSVQITTRGVWDAANNPRYYNPVTVTKGVGNFIVVRINERDTTAGQGIPNIGRGNINTLVASLRFPTKRQDSICGLTPGIIWQVDPATNCNNPRSNLSNIRYFAQDETVAPLGDVVNYQTTTVPAVTDIVEPVPVASVPNLNNPGFFLYRFSNGSVNLKPRRFRVYFTPDPAYAAACRVRQRIFDTTLTNPTQVFTKTQSFTPTPATCNGRPINRGILQIYSYNACGDSVVAGDIPISFVDCEPYVFQNGFAQVSRTSVCQGQSVIVTLDTGAVRNRLINGNLVRVGWEPRRPSDNAYYSYDNGATWRSTRSFTFDRLWDTARGPIQNIVIRVRDARNCVSDSFVIQITINKSFVPGTKPYIVSKDTLPAAICTPGRVRLTLRKDGDPNVVYTWRTGFGGGNLYTTPTGNTAATNESVVYYEKPAGYLGRATVYAENVCFGNLRDSIDLNFIAVPDPKITLLANGAVVTGGIVPLNAPITLRAASFARNFQGTQYLWTINVGPNQTIKPLTTNEDESITFADPGTGSIVLRALAPGGSCFADSVVAIEVKQVNQFFLPTAFSPAGTGRNAVFMIQGEGLTNNDYRLVVLNRWGQIVFETTDYSKPWDGKDKSGNECTQDTYTYGVKGKFQDGTTFEKTGIINLVR